MSVVVFSGPSLRPGDLDAFPGVTRMPPAARGDLWTAATGSPDAICLIDGYFDGRPSVMHKEILWAMDSGIPVYGASSMGALRAAELHQFGMIGVGRVFGMFRDGLINDDDEVTLIHGPERFGYPKISEPMVNLRHAMACAVRQKAIPDDIAAQVLLRVKAMFYQDRTFAAAVACAAACGLDDDECQRLSRSLHQAPDLKREDALLAVRSAIEGRGRAPDGEGFVRTSIWDEAMTEVRRGIDKGAGL